MRALVAAALVLVVCRTASAQGVPSELGRLEREAVDEALAARGLKVDPAPQGKTIGSIQVVNLPVFSGRDWLFQYFNFLHVTTREVTIRRELLFASGQRYDPALIDESARNLRADPSYSSVVVIVPVASATPGQVDLLVVTRDVWSLRLNTDFEAQQGKLVYFTGSLAENNLFGRRKRLALVFEMDQGAMAVGPSYVDPNIAGTRLTLSSSVRALFRREGGNLEGSSSSTVFGYPLYSLASRWGASVSVGHADSVARAFTGTDLARVDFRSTPDIKERWPWIYRIRSFGASTSGVRQLGHDIIHRISAGHEYSVVRPSFTADFPDDPEARAEFAREKFPRSERVSDLFVGYSVFDPRYRVYHDLNSFDLREDRRLGGSADARVSVAARALGGEGNFATMGFGLGWAFGALGGYQTAAVRWGTRLEHGRLVDQSFSVGGYAASPVIKRVIRVVANAGAAALLDDTQNTLYTLGGDSGLRGYTIGDRRGQTYALGHLEVRSMALPVASFRLGGLVFCDAGDAGSSDAGGGVALARAFRSLGNLSPKTDVGFGMRLLIPQLNSYVLRLDWAFALQQTERTRPGWPGRISLGFRQVF
jgi:hypothetical protein